MRKIIILTILFILAVSSVHAAKYFVLDVNNIDGSVTFNSYSLKEIDRVIENNGKQGFLIKTVSYLGKDINKMFYDISENKNYIIYVPYNKDAAKIELYNLRNSMIMELNVGSFADTCGDKICEDYETFETCSVDCSQSGKDIISNENRDKVTEPISANQALNQTSSTSEGNTPADNEPNYKNEAQKSNINYYFVGILVAFIVVAILIFVFIKKKKEDKTISSLKEYIIENQRKGFDLQKIRNALLNSGYVEKEIEKAIKSI